MSIGLTTVSEITNIVTIYQSEHIWPTRTNKNSAGNQSEFETALEKGAKTHVRWLENICLIQISACLPA